MGDFKLYINLLFGFFLSEQLLRCNQHQGWHLKARRGSKIPTTLCLTPRRQLRESWPWQRVAV